MDDPEFRAIYVDYDAAFAWAPDDPRLEVLAARAHRWVAARYRGRGEAATQDPTIAQLVATSAGLSSPGWDRLAELGRKLAASGTPDISRPSGAAR
jgi:hypothetical protein